VYHTPDGEKLFDPGSYGFNDGLFWGTDWKTGVEHTYCDDGQENIERTFKRLAKSHENLPSKRLATMKCKDGISRFVEVNEKGVHIGKRCERYEHFVNKVNTSASPMRLMLNFPPRIRHSNRARLK
jgi:hypothetical protein